MGNQIKIPGRFDSAESAGTCPRNDQQSISFTDHGLSPFLPPACRPLRVTRSLIEALPSLIHLPRYSTSLVTAPRDLVGTLSGLCRDEVPRAKRKGRLRAAPSPPAGGRQGAPFSLFGGYASRIPRHGPSLIPEHRRKVGAARDFFGIDCKDGAAALKSADSGKVEKVPVAQGVLLIYLYMA